MTQQIQLQLFEGEDGNHRLNLVTPEEGYTLSAQDVSNLIGTLATQRSDMLPPVEQADIQLAGLPNVADDPRILWAYDEMNDRIALAARHPGYGWIGYSLTAETAGALQSGLGEILEMRQRQRQLPN